MVKIVCFILCDFCCCSVAKSCPTLCDPMGFSIPGSPSPSLSPGVCSNLCSLSQWCYLTISSSATLFSSCPQSFPAPGSFPMSWLFISGGQSTGASALVIGLSISRYVILAYMCLVHTIFPQYPWGTGSRTHADTTIRRCSSPIYKMAQHSWPLTALGAEGQL